MPNIYADPNAIDFDESYTQGPDTVIVRNPIFMTQAMVKIGKLAPLLTHLSSVLQPSNPTSNGQSQDIETNTDLHYNINSTQVPESNTDIETAFEPMQQSPSRQRDNPSTLEINDLTAEITLQNKPSHSRGGNIIYVLILTLISQRYTDNNVFKILFQPLFVRRSYYLFLFFSFFCSGFVQFFSGGIYKKIQKHQLNSKFFLPSAFDSALKKLFCSPLLVKN